MKKSTFLLGIVGGFALGFGVAVGFLNRGTPAKTVEVPEADGSERPVSVFRRPPPTIGPTHQFTEGNAAETPADGHKPTPEEQLVLEELGRRVRSGEYVLHSENPFMLRLRGEMLKQGLESEVPPLMVSRQDYFSELNIAPETISKLTNHAAKIAEASLAVRPILAEISTAKVEYDAKAREFLTPEQYERFKDFETRQAFEKKLSALMSMELNRFPRPM